MYRHAAPWLPALPTPSFPVFIWSLRAGFVGAWVAWIVMLAFAHRSQIQQRQALKWCGFTALALAILLPPVFSSDVFGYIAHDRMYYRHGLNPYVQSLDLLDGTGDPAADFNIWRVLLPYGPFWLLLTSALGSLASAMGGLFGEVLAHKLLAGAGHLATAVFISRIAETRHPGFGGPAMLAVGLNPLLLIEGPATGHNDFIAIGLLAFAAWCWSVGRLKTGSLAIGFAVATKITAAGVIPLILAACWKHAHGPRKWSAPLVSLVLASAPLVVLSVFFGGPSVVLNVLGGRFASMRPATAVWVAPLMILAAFTWAFRVIRRTSDERIVAWLTGWVVVATAIVLTTTTLRFPWYVAWPLAPAFAGWLERDRILIIAVSICGLLLLWGYTLPVG